VTESDGGVNYFRLGVQKDLSEKAFELSLEVCKGTRANILIENESGRF